MLSSLFLLRESHSISEHKVIVIEVEIVKIIFPKAVHLDGVEEDNTGWRKD